MRVGELGRRRHRHHRAAGRDRRRIAQIQRSRGLAGPRIPLVVPLDVPVTRVWRTSARDRARRPARSRAEAARVADGVESAPVADGAELARVADGAEPTRVADRAELARVAKGSELACAGPATPNVELVAGHLSIQRVRKPRTPIRGTLGVPWPAIAAPRPVTHPISTCIPTRRRTRHSARLPLFAR